MLQVINVHSATMPNQTSVLVYTDLRVRSIKSTQVDLDFPSRVKSVCSSVTIEIFWRCQFHYKSFQVKLKSPLDQ